MLKIMVVDDEPLYRQYLVQSVNWQDYGFEVCCEAKNGLDALEKVNEVHPDIALVDINMPFMNGLELTERLREQYPKIAIVLVTGLCEFDYARKAVKLGVFDYILKPFNNEELMIPLLKIKHEMERDMIEKESQKEEDELIRERLLNQLISNEFTLTDSEMKFQLSRLGIDVHTLLFQVAVLEIENLYQKWTDANEIVQWKLALANLLHEIVSVRGQNIVFNGPEGKIISLVQFDHEADLKGGHVEKYMRLCEVVRQYFDFMTITVGVGRPVQGFQTVRSSYRDALASLQNKFIMGDSKVIEYSSLEASGINIGFYSNEINEKLLLGLNTRDLDGIKEELTDVFHIIKEKRLSSEYVITIFAGLVSLCLSHIVELGKSIEDIYGKGFSPYTDIQHMESLDASYLWFVALFEKIIVYSNKNKSTKSVLLVRKAKEYIGSNLQHNELDLEKIAQNIFVNSSYLRKTFKKEAGMTVSAYITSERMRKAKELLNDSGDIAVSRISEMVGYSDVSYFSKCFKKHTGLWPSEYANMKKSGGSARV